MKRVLINGGGHSEIPLILASKKMGFYTVTTGINRDGLGHRYSDKYIFADFSNKEQIKNIIEEENIDFAIPSCNDFSILTLSAINEDLNIGVFDSYETTKTIHHKTEFKELAFKLNLSVAKSKMVDKNYDLEGLNLNYPLIVKPIDLSGGKGITKVESFLELNNALDLAFENTRENRILIEEFIDGTHHSCSLLIKDREIIFSFFADEYFYINPYLVEGAYSNQDLDTHIKNSILRDTDRLVNTLKLKDGLVHIQFIVRDGKPYILEITRRSPGDLYLNLVSYSMNIDFATLIIKLYTGLFDKSFIKSMDGKIDRIVLRHCLMTNRVGKIARIDFHKTIKNRILDKLLWYKKGDEVKDFMSYKAGIIFFLFDDVHSLLKELNDIHNLIKFVLEK